MTYNFFSRTASQLAKARKYFHKKPLGRRWYLMSSSVRDCEFSTITSGTERERGFVRIVVLVLSGTFIKKNQNNAQHFYKKFLLQFLLKIFHHRDILHCLPIFLLNHIKFCENIHVCYRKGNF